MLPTIRRLCCAMPGEDVHSLIRRNALMSGFSTDRAFIKAMQAYVQHDLRALPKFLPQFCSAVDNAYGTPMEVLLGRSLLPYYGSVLTAEAYQRLLTRILEAVPGVGRPTRLPLIGSTSLFAEPHCAQCDSHSERICGMAVVMSIHLPEFVTHCGEHGLALTSAPGSATYHTAVQVPPTEVRERNAHEFSVRSSQLLREEFTPGARLEHLKGRLLAHGFCTKAGRYRLQAITEATAAAFEGRFMDCRLSEVVANGQAAQHAIAALRREGRQLHPVYFILLDWALDCCSPNKVGVERTPRRPGPSKELLHQEVAAGKSMDQIAKENNFSPSTVAVYADLYSIPRATLPRRKTAAVTGDVVAMLSSQTPEKVARQVGLSEATVWRIGRAAGVQRCRSLEDLQREERAREGQRQRWLDECLTHQAWGRNQVREGVPLVWKWLYRDDPVWLDMHSPPRRRSSGAGSRLSLEMTKQLVAPALAAAHSLDRRTDRPLRRSERRMSEAMGLTPYEFVRLTKLESSVRELVDTRGAFVQRRLRWSARTLRAAGRAARWRIVQKACIATRK